MPTYWKTLRIIEVWLDFGSLRSIHALTTKVLKKQREMKVKMEINICKNNGGAFENEAKAVGGMATLFWSPKTDRTKKYLMGLIYRIQNCHMVVWPNRPSTGWRHWLKSKIEKRKGDVSTSLSVQNWCRRSRRWASCRCWRMVTNIQGVKYKSLSGVAYAITGTRWNGNVFWSRQKPPIDDLT